MVSPDHDYLRYVKVQNTTHVSYVIKRDLPIECEIYTPIYGSNLHTRVSHYQVYH